VGHSETQTTQEQKLRKSIQCKTQGIEAIVCFVKPEELPMEVAQECLIAWEDPANISKNGHYNPKDPQKISQQILSLKKRFGMNSRILYGGSVNENNAKPILQNELISGALIGNASLNPKNFCEIIKFCL